MSRTSRFARSRGPGYAPWPRHMVVRVNDLVPAEAADRDAVVAELASRTIAVADRFTPARDGVQAVLSTNAAGTIVTLERRTSLRIPRGAALRALTATLEDVLNALAPPDVGQPPGA